MHFQVLGDPHPWPRCEGIPSTACAVIVVDMQHDYCSPGYYLGRLGYDTRRLSEPVERIRRVLQVARRSGLHVIFTRHGRVPDPDSSNGSQRLGTQAMPRTALRGEPGWEIVPELAPELTDSVMEKSTCGAFVSGELDRTLRRRGIRHVALCGNTIDVCVHSTLRAAVDLAYECVLLADCCAAVNDGLHAWAIESVKIENGVFGTVASAQAFIDAFPNVE